MANELSFIENFFHCQTYMERFIENYFLCQTYMEKIVKIGNDYNVSVCLRVLKLFGSYSKSMT